MFQNFIKDIQLYYTKYFRTLKISKMLSPRKPENKETKEDVFQEVFNLFDKVSLYIYIYKK